MNQSQSIRYSRVKIFIKYNVIISNFTDGVYFPLVMNQIIIVLIIQIYWENKLLCSFNPLLPPALSYCCSNDSTQRQMGLWGRQTKSFAKWKMARFNVDDLSQEFALSGFYFWEYFSLGNNYPWNWNILISFWVLQILIKY